MFSPSLRGEEGAEPSRAGKARLQAPKGTGIDPKRRFKASSIFIRVAQVIMPDSVVRLQVDLGFYSPGPLALCLQKGGLGRQRLPVLQKHLPSPAVSQPFPAAWQGAAARPGAGRLCAGKKSAFGRCVLEMTRYSIMLRRRLRALLNPRRRTINLIQLPLFPGVVWLK